MSKKKKSIWTLLQAFLFPYKGGILRCFFAIFITTGLVMSYPYLIGSIMGGANVQGATAFFKQTKPIFFLLFSLLSLQVFISYFRIRDSVRLAESVVNDLRVEIYKKISQIPLGVLNSEGQNSFSHRISEDLSILRQMLINVFPQIVRQVLVLIISLSFAFKISPFLMGIMFVSLLPLVFVASFLRLKIRDASESLQDHLEKIGGSFESLCQGLAEVKILGSDGISQQSFLQKISSFSRSIRVYSHWRGLLVSLLIFLIFTMIAIVIGVGALLMARGDLQLVDYTRFLLFTVFASTALSSLPDLFGQWNTASVAALRIHHLLEIPSEREGGLKNFDSQQGIVFDNVFFSYPSRPNQLVFHSLSFAIETGETIAIVGANGAGKSTLFSLLSGLYLPNSGQIRVQGVPVHKACLSSLRQRIGFVPQEIFLFEGSIWENLICGKMNASDEEILNASHQSGLADFVNDLPEGYNTMIGKRGVLLSGGQKQRIAIARAILRNPQILLFDEAMSSLDNMGEKMIKNLIKGNFSQQICLIITHQIETARLANRILFLSKGSLVAFGTHKDLLVENHSYSLFAQSGLEV